MHLKSTTLDSEDCIKIRENVSKGLRIGDDASHVEPYLNSLGYKANYMDGLNAYSSTIFIKKYLLGEEHYVSIYIQIKENKIVSIKVSDVNRFL